MVWIFYGSNSFYFTRQKGFLYRFSDSQIFSLVQQYMNQNLYSKNSPTQMKCRVCFFHWDTRGLWLSSLCTYLRYDKHDLKSWYLASVSTNGASINIINTGYVDHIGRYYRVNIISSTSKPDMILLIYIEIRRYLKPS